MRCELAGGVPSACPMPRAHVLSLLLASFLDPAASSLCLTLLPSAPSPPLEPRAHRPGSSSSITSTRPLGPPSPFLSLSPLWETDFPQVTTHSAGGPSAGFFWSPRPSGHHTFHHAPSTYNVGSGGTRGAEASGSCGAAEDGGGHGKCWGDRDMDRLEGTERVHAAPGEGSPGKGCPKNGWWLAGMSTWLSDSHVFSYLVLLAH